MFRISALSLALGFSCQAAAPEVADTTRPPEPPSSAAEPESESKPEEPPLATIKPGPVYFRADSELVRFDGIEATRLRLPDHDYYIGEIHVRGEKAYVESRNEVFEIIDDRFERVVDFGLEPAGRSVLELAFGEPGQYFATFHDGVRQWSNGAWVLLAEKPAFGDDVERFLNLVVGGDDRLWLTTQGKLHDHLHYRDTENRWHRVDLDVIGDNEFAPSLLRVSPTGDVYALLRDRVVRIRPGGDSPKLETIEIPGRTGATYRNLEIGSDGRLALATVVCDLARFDPDDPTSVWLRDEDEDLGCSGVEAIALDQRGRMWVASPAGLDILGPEREHVHYPSGSLLELIGLIRSISIVGGGPSDLSSPGPVLTGHVKGKLVRLDEHRRPLAGKLLELCPFAETNRAEGPCSRARVVFRGHTDDAGEFTFTDVPLGSWSLVVMDRKWQGATGVRLTQKGQTQDVGVVEIPLIRPY